MTTHQRCAQCTSEAVQAIAWKAQTRLCQRYRLLEGKGKLKVQVCSAIARDKVFHLVIPARPTDLSDEDLGKVTAGKDLPGTIGREDARPKCADDRAASGKKSLYLARCSSAERGGPSVRVYQVQERDRSVAQFGVPQVIGVATKRLQREASDPVCCPAAVNQPA